MTRKTEHKAFPDVAYYPPPVEFLCCLTWIPWPRYTELVECPECHSTFIRDDRYMEELNASE